VAAACNSSCLREPGEPMIVLRRCRRGRDDEDVVEGGARNLGLQGRLAARAKAVGGTSGNAGEGRREVTATMYRGSFRGFATPRSAHAVARSLPRLSAAINRRLGFHSLPIFLYVTNSHFTIYIYFYSLFTLTIIFLLAFFSNILHI